MTGETLQYWKIHEEETPRNITRPHTRGAILMITRGNKQGGLEFVTLGYTEKAVRRIWDASPMPDNLISRVNAIGQGQPNDKDFLDFKKSPIWDLEIKGVDAEETDAPHIELIEIKTDIDTI